MKHLGPHGIDLNAPGGIQALLAFHRAAFGDARMEGSDPPAPQPPVSPAPAPQDPKPTPVPTAPPEDRGYPANTSVADMSVEQQVAYWKHQSRKHEDTAKGRGDYDTVKGRAAQLEDELNALRTAQMSESEKALADARRAGAEEARAAATQEAADRDRARGVKLVDSFLDLAMGTGGRLDRERVAPVLEAIDKSRYLNAAGDVDTEGLTRLIDSLAGPAPAGGGKPGQARWPATGQGRQEVPAIKTGIAAGAEMYASSRGRSRATSGT